MGILFNEYKKRFELPTTSEPADGAEEDVFSSTALMGPVRHFGITSEDYQTLRNWAAYTPGGAAIIEYADQSYLVNGQETSLAQLFLLAAQNKITNLGVTQALTPQYNERGELTSGATWASEFFDKYNRVRAGLGVTEGDGVTLQQKIDSALAIIADRVQMLGLRYSEDEILDIATMAVNSSWNDAQVIDKLLTNYKLDELDPGDLTTAQSNISTLAKQYLVPITDSQAASYAQRLYLGEISTDTIEDQFKKQLIAEMPFLESAITSGLRPMDVFASGRSFAAEELEMDVSSIDLNDPKWRDMLISTDSNGNKRAATLSEIRTQVRNTSDWSRTTAAKQSASNIAGAITQLFGRSGF
jgi:hypothetical protein